MTIRRHIGLIELRGLREHRGLRRLCLLFMMIAITGFANAQIRVGGNIYGGGNQGNIGGSTKVTIQAGDIGYTEEPIENRPLQSPRGKVFGGSRMSNVGGNTFVHIDGKNATGYILANYVFGGNDIAGQIGTAKAVGETTPSELTEILTIPEPTESEISAAGSREQYIKNYKAAHPRKNAIDDTWNSYVRVSAKLESSAELFTQSEIDAAGSSDPAYGKTTNVRVRRGWQQGGSRCNHIQHLCPAANCRRPAYSYKHHRIYETRDR